MARRPGMLVRCTCVECGHVVLSTGSNSTFKCDQCCPVTSMKRLAHKAVADAVKCGDLQPATECTCVDCGRPATEYDHRDYDEPLQVDPVCRRCNVRRGPAINNRLVLRQFAQTVQSSISNVNPTPASTRGTLISQGA